ncbi:MAG: restriction endonuclease, partial [Clostridiales bacterium]|nr:restriction endonuclease [Clostridiales bacterium]
MAVPKFFDFFYPVLVVLENQGATKVPILRQKVADLMKLTVEEREQLVPSGTQSTYGNRVAWALSYMKKAQLVKSPLRGTYEITPAGRRALIEVGDRIDLNYL